MIKVETKINGMKDLDKRIKKIKAAPNKMLRVVGKEEVKETKIRIRSTKNDPDGKPWAPWSFATMKERVRQGNVQRGLLYRTGALLNSIKYTVKKGKLSVFSPLKYAKFLQFGTPKMPARPFLGWSKAAINRAVKILTKEVR